MKHFSIEEQKMDEIQEIAEREGRKDYDIIREAISLYLREKETEERVHGTVPEDGVVRSGDKAIELNFAEMWAEDSATVKGATDGEPVRAIEDGGKYFTYYKFLYHDGYYVCQHVVPIGYELFDELVNRVNKYQI